MALSGDRAKLYDEEAKRKSGIVQSQEVSNSWEKVRSSTTSSWLCCKLDVTGKILEQVAHGEEGGLEALKTHLTDDTITWVIFSFIPGYPYGEGSKKLAFLTCVGQTVSVMKRGKVALQKSGVYNTFEGVAADAGVYQGISEIKGDVILKELQRNMPKASLME
jgi:hypothetical protein